MPFCCCCCFVSPCFAREWSDSSGRFSVDADLVEYDAKKVKLKRKDNAKLITVERRKLSKADRDYLAAKQNVDSSRKLQRIRPNADVIQRTC